MTNQYSYAEDFTANVKKATPKQADPNISSAAKVYILSRMNKDSAAHGYRNGEFQGNKYMTSEDFVTYFHSRGKISYAEGTRKKITEENAGEILRSGAGVKKEQKKAEPVNDDVKVYRPAGKKKADPNVAGRTAVFNRQDGSKLGRIKAVANDWMPEEKIVNVKTRRSPRNIAKAVIAITGVALSLMMIVGGTVLVSDAKREVKELEAELKALEIVSNELDLKLDMKNDVNLLKDKAINELGMISKEYVDAEYLGTEGSDSIKAYDSESDKNVGISAILSAFGIGG